MFILGDYTRLVVGVHDVIAPLVIFFFDVPCLWPVMSLRGRPVLTIVHVTWCTWVAEVYFELCEETSGLKRVVLFC